MDSVDVSVFLKSLKEAYRSLQLISCVGRVTIEADHVYEREGPITEDEYIRQLYRQHGWLDAFRREDAERVVETLMETIVEQRGDWQAENPTWLPWNYNHPAA
ncbi:hypothetical protein TOPH_01946 [Tolypocladium ophioglossoides CBS 100239]|uniref:Uncharacterized protein n=1 Tax=Tolypocladium ophioglossoides (strain CBS 100239) TaxID=1163406 RepID=A0A0L0NJM5_TOLOC|nr:hypothetical protein TOPH_01946 [Tolypocladium ophioglossoides CBS 100239]